MTILLVLVSGLSNFYFFYTPVSASVMSVLATISGVIPVPLWEILAVLFVAWVIWTLINAISRHHIANWFAGVFMGLSIGVFIFVFVWGLNYYAPPINERLNFPVRNMSVPQLVEATDYYLSMANELSTQVPRHDDGTLNAGKFADLAEQAGSGFEVLGKSNVLFRGSTEPVKPLISSSLFAKSGITGIFVDFTGESCVSTDTYVCDLPFTMCHEMSHRMGFAAENEANFAAFLACDASELPIFRYAGYYAAFSYCYSALSKVDKDAAAAIRQKICPALQSDFAHETEHYNKIINDTANKITDAVNDTYLKAFSQSSGIRSYGEVADLLICWYFFQIKS